MDSQNLQQFGLSKREIAVYLALLQTGTTTTGALVKASKVSYAKIYEVLQKLADKGLIHYTIKGKTKHYTAAQPQVLLDYYHEKEKVLQGLVKEMEQLSQKITPSHAVIYEGFKALKSVFYQLFDYVGKGGEYCVFPIGKQLATAEIQRFFAQIFIKREAMNIAIRTLPHSQWKGIIKKYYRHYKYLSVRYTNHEYPTGIFIFKDHVLHILWDETSFGILVHSTAYADRWQRFFDEEWRGAKP